MLNLNTESAAKSQGNSSNILQLHVWPKTRCSVSNRSITFAENVCSFVVSAVSSDGLAKSYDQVRPSVYTRPALNLSVLCNIFGLRYFYSHFKKCGLWCTRVQHDYRRTETEIATQKRYVKHSIGKWCLRFVTTWYNLTQISEVVSPRTAANNDNNSAGDINRKQDVEPYGGTVCSWHWRNMIGIKITTVKKWIPYFKSPSWLCIPILTYKSTRVFIIYQSICLIERTININSCNILIQSS